MTSSAVLSPIARASRWRSFAPFAPRCRIRLPLFVRISASDWTEGGWTIDDSVEFARILRGEGVDVIDCSSGGNVPHAKIETGPGYQVPFAEAIKRAAGIATAAVGMINTRLADEIVRSEQADMVLIARQIAPRSVFPALTRRKSSG
jgi:2,4-dienoyl-CoA reductase-like NADH-dependent reductase (Old Yellow Enzyme family)